MGCGNDVMGCGNDMMGCGNDMMGCGNDVMGCGNDMMGCGNDVMGCGNSVMGAGYDGIGYGVRRDGGRYAWGVVTFRGCARRCLPRSSSWTSLAGRSIPSVESRYARGW